MAGNGDCGLPLIHIGDTTKSVVESTNLKIFFNVLQIQKFIPTR